MDRPGFVETPGRRVSRKSSAFEGSENETETSDSPVATRSKSTTRRRASEKVKTEEEETPAKPATNGKATSGKATNGKAATPKSKSKAGQKSASRVVDGWEEGLDPRIDYSGHYEFGGSAGVTAMMIGFPLLMYYMWIGATYYNGKFPTRAEGQSFADFFSHLANLVYTGAYPSLKAWTIYWVFFIFEGACYVLLPGVSVTGRRLPHMGGKQLSYHCSGVSSFYTSIVLALGLHFSGLFKLYTIIDEFGPLLSVAILSGFLVSFVAYFSALARGAQHRMTGSPIYDFFMGAELNPRMFGILDFKMFFEVRLPWFILLFLSMGAAARQWEVYGYVSGEVMFLLMAHFLYANACAKGEECIVSTWDMYYEKWGFMLIFWNLAGVPLSYCHCTIYLANHDPAEYHWNRFFLAFLYIGYLFVYWVWDTTNSQKNRFRQQERGTLVTRKTFPQLPWQTLENPKTLTSEDGSKILVDGWYGKARKIHYTCDLYFALNWGLITGFSSPFPWFYPVFFAAMISHRALRDIQRCRTKYGETWLEYERQVPYLFIPDRPITLGYLEVFVMLIRETIHDVPTKADGLGIMRIYVFHPTIPGYPKARFPGVVVFSEIYQVTGPVARFARQIAGQGYICAAPSSYHEFTGPEPLQYNAEDTDKGNEWKISKKLEAYDEDASLTVNYLLSLPTCNGRVGATGMCLGGHLAYRCALDSRIKAAVCYFATDIHSQTLGKGKNDDSLARAGDIKGELLMIFGKSDTHVPPEGRDLIRKTLHEKGVLFSFYEVAWAQHAFIRDELSKGRYDPAISKICFDMLLELFGRTLKLDLGEHDGKELVVEDVC
ncbi:C-24(28) sterol reductase [Penicillium chermesinum]|uniref:Delta(24(24(1)))-sterol reductase n=1 Tax=Penicillium chermesinum TaxID=63820 RepID=A0A9W9TBR0_9EURO|nr:C-24(28) sterol reductase [Penicillium chermesinum]KAJ5216917.1 C-24(28) sterol reductase [Penicillium chermesinum]KAJ6171471.1 C-24(28) sterol reductase [Penicillium chermesinum]